MFENEPKHIHRWLRRYNAVTAKNAIDFLDPKNRVLVALDCI